MRERERQTDINGRREEAVGGSLFVQPLQRDLNLPAPPFFFLHIYFTTGPLVSIRVCVSSWQELQELDPQSDYWLPNSWACVIVKEKRTCDKHLYEKRKCSCAVFTVKPAC